MKDLFQEESSAHYKTLGEVKDAVLIPCQKSQSSGCYRDCRIRQLLISGCLIIYIVPLSKDYRWSSNFLHDRVIKQSPNATLQHSPITATSLSSFLCLGPFQKPGFPQVLNVHAFFVFPVCCLNLGQQGIEEGKGTLVEDPTPGNSL